MKIRAGLKSVNCDCFQFPCDQLELSKSIKSASINVSNRHYYSEDGKRKLSLKDSAKRKSSVFQNLKRERQVNLGVNMKEKKTLKQSEPKSMKEDAMRADEFYWTTDISQKNGFIRESNRKGNDFTIFREENSVGMRNSSRIKKIRIEDSRKCKGEILLEDPSAILQLTAGKEAELAYGRSSERENVESLHLRLTVDDKNSEKLEKSIIGIPKTWSKDMFYHSEFGDLFQMRHSKLKLSKKNVSSPPERQTKKFPLQLDSNSQQFYGCWNGGSQKEFLENGFVVYRRLNEDHQTTAASNQFPSSKKNSANNLCQRNLQSSHSLFHGNHKQRLCQNYESSPSAVDISYPVMDFWEIVDGNLEAKI